MKVSVSYLANLPELFGTSNTDFKSESELSEYMEKINSKLSEISKDKVIVLYLTEKEYNSANISELIPYSIVGNIKYDTKENYKYAVIYRTIYFYYKNNKICDNYGEISDSKYRKLDKSEIYGNLGIKKTKVISSIPYFKKVTREKAENIIPNVFYEIDYPGCYFAIVENRKEKQL